MLSLLKQVSPVDVLKPTRSKVTVVGVGSVGMAVAFSLMGTADEVALVDVMQDKVRGEVLDLQHGQQFSRRCIVRGGSDYKESENSDIVVITAGARQNEGESRLSLVQRNVEIFKKIIPSVIKYSPKCILVIVSNPVDILTYVAMKISNFPPHRVIGSGTMLDSARFRYLLGEKLGISANSVHGYVIGEHGDSSVPVWSNLSVGGVRLSSRNPNIGKDSDPEKFNAIHKEVVQSAYDIIKLKGYTSWAIGVTCRYLCEAILHNTHAVFPLSTFTKDIKGDLINGIQQEVCISLPCLITSAGIDKVVQQDLSTDELAKLNESVKTLSNIIKDLKL